MQLFSSSSFVMGSGTPACHGGVININNININTIVANNRKKQKGSK